MQMEATIALSAILRDFRGPSQRPTSTTPQEASLFRPSNFCFYAGSLKDKILLLTNPVVPIFVVILVNPSDETTVVQLHNHAYMTFKLLSACLYCNVPIRPYNVVALPTNPDLFQNGARRCWDDRLVVDPLSACEFSRVETKTYGLGQTNLYVYIERLVAIGETLL